MAAEDTADLPRPALVDAVGAADAQAIVQYGQTDAVEALRVRDQTVTDDINCGLVWDQQRSRKKLASASIPPSCLRLPSSVRGGAHWVAKEAMREFMADVASMAARVMGVIVHDSRFMSARYGDGRETRRVAEEGTIRIELAQGDQPDLEMGADGHRISGINCVQSHLMPYPQSNAICFYLEPPLESQSLASQFAVSADHDRTAFKSA